LSVTGVYTATGGGGAQSIEANPLAIYEPPRQRLRGENVPNGALNWYAGD